MPANLPRKKRRRWRRLRLYFRGFRIVVLLVVLLLLSGILYLNQVGLPEVVKAPLLEKIREHGIELEFARLRIRWFEGVVAENVRFGQADSSLTPQLAVKQVRVQLNERALFKGRLQVDGLWLRDGQLTWRVDQTNRPPRELQVDTINSQLRFLPGDQWLLDNFTGQFGGTRFRLSGVVTNASHVREWPVFRRTRPKEPKSDGVRRQVRYIADVLDRINFATPPELTFDINGDALDLPTFRARLSINAGGAVTPWGNISQGRFTALMFPASNGVTRAEIALLAGASHTPWVNVTNLKLKAELVTFEQQSGIVEGRLELDAAQALTAWCRASNLTVEAEWIHSLTNPVPITGQARIHGEGISNRWALARSCDLVAEMTRVNAFGVPKLTLGWWTNVQPFAFEWTCDARDVIAREPGLDLDRVHLSGDWHTPTLNLSELRARAYGGEFEATARLDVETRSATAFVKTDVDAHRLGPALGSGAQRWLSQFTWEQAPSVEGTIQLTLPAWTNRHPDWREEVLPTLVLDGHFKTDRPGSYRGLQVSSASSHLSYTNRCWRLSDLAITRPEGGARVEYRENERTRDFYARVDSGIDPKAVEPLLSEKARKALNLVQFSAPPVIKAEIRGRHRQPDLTVLKAEVALTNFSFRGEWASSLQTEVDYTNRVIHFSQTRITRGTESGSVASVVADFNSELVFLTNAISTMEPMVIARAIGPPVVRAITPYQFKQSPRARVQGIIPMHGEEKADLHFDIDGGPFHWWKFNLDRLAGHVHWSGLRVHLRDVRAGFYQGAAAGYADLDFSQHAGTEIQFAVALTNVMFRSFMADFSGGTNQPEGLLSGWVQITGGNTEDWRTVKGLGAADLRDGLIWDIPMFGVLSPVLNGVVPGMGNSRATAANCTFNITNGVVRSEDLQIRSQGARLQYRGTIDLMGQLDARVEAELLRDMWLVGPLVSTVFWPVTKMFEYRVSGQLAQPQLDPIWVFPKLMSLPFHPMRTLKNFFPEDPNARTNAPPIGSQISPNR